MIVNCDKGLLMLKLITVRKRSYGKVMFSHLSDSHSAHEGRAWQGACVAGETATATDGTHPIGMLSC